MIGGILGGVKGALAGILIGGGGTVVATEGKDVELPAGHAFCGCASMRRSSSAAGCVAAASIIHGPCIGAAYPGLVAAPGFNGFQRPPPR